MMFDLQDNDQLSKFTSKDKKALLKFLKNYYIEYKSSLDLDEKMTFGIEIECFVSGKSQQLYEHNKPTSFSLCKEKSVHYKYGWEFKSPILKDDTASWSEIKNTCEYLKSFCKTNEHCGGHIHFGASIFDDNCKYLMNLVYLWMAYEDIIFRFGNGETLNTRYDANLYANPVTNRFKNLMFFKGVPTDTYTFLRLFKSRMHNASLNFYNYFLYYTHETDDKNTIEIRSPNGTLEEVIWQNNIHFFGRLIQAAMRDDLDLLNLYFLISGNNYSDSDIFRDYDHVNLDKALELADLIYDNNSDKLDFLKQYIKNGKSTDSDFLVKTKKFWK